MGPLRPSLRLRVAAGFALLGLAVSLALGGWLYVASRDLEQRLIDEALGAELEDYLARLARNPQSLPPQTSTIRGYVARSEEDPKPPLKGSRRSWRTCPKGASPSSSMGPATEWPFTKDQTRPSTCSTAGPSSPDASSASNSS